MRGLMSRLRLRVRLKMGMRSGNMTMKIMTRAVRSGSVWSMLSRLVSVLGRRHWFMMMRRNLARSRDQHWMLRLLGGRLSRMRIEKLVLFKDIHHCWCLAHGKFVSVLLILLWMMRIFLSSLGLTPRRLSSMCEVMRTVIFSLMYSFLLILPHTLRCPAANSSCQKYSHNIRLSPEQNTAAYIAWSYQELTLWR